MSQFPALPSHPLTHPDNIVIGDGFRFSILTNRLIRLEYNPNNQFEDRPTQTVLNRSFPAVDYHLKQSADCLEIDTPFFHLYYNRKFFSSNGLTVKVKGNLTLYHSIWHYGQPAHYSQHFDLKGTVQTLDEVDGDCKLEAGIVSYFGYSLLDDSASLVLTDNGFVSPRPENIKDLYLFAYGRDYRSALKDFYYLCGKTPMLPRFALGNWWSRYYPYNEKSYLALLDHFSSLDIPLSVAVLDMDWHYVTIDPQYGSGWTGYSWNRQLFPEPASFLAELHRRGLKVTLNDHPAEGIQPFEDIYPAFAKKLGIDPNSQQPIAFDIANPDFLDDYFYYVHQPLEEQGVDFWWIDWQQGNTTQIAGLNPLWMLNHYHFLHQLKKDRRPMIFSRYAGPGSHRYPIGFSGDTVTSWASLDFQPYFTSSASNIGYGWWSHDIGGHMQGAKDDELMVRWVQFGVFSPINRLHSTNNLFNGKEPWRYGSVAAKIMTRFLQLRHQLIPYLYTMNYQAYHNDRPLIEPLVYAHPNQLEAYKHRNTYFFGRSLLVIPITSPTLIDSHNGRADTWLPAGDYIDIFSGQHYHGNRQLTFYRPLNHFPVLAKAGTILPLTPDIHTSDNPNNLYLKIYVGANGHFTLYEDDNDSLAYTENIYAKTPFSLISNDTTSQFKIAPSQGKRSLIPTKRCYTLDFICLQLTDFQVMVDDNLLTLTNDSSSLSNTESFDTISEQDFFMNDVVNGLSPTAKKDYLSLDCPPIGHYQYDTTYHRLTISLPPITTSSTVTVNFAKSLQPAYLDPTRRIFYFLNQADIDFTLKQSIYQIICQPLANSDKLRQLYSLKLEPDLLGCLMDLLVN